MARREWHDDDAATCVLDVEDHDEIHTAEARNYDCTVLLRIDRPVGALAQPARRGVAVQSDNQLIPELASSIQILNMAAMQHVEHTIGKNQAPGPRPREPIRIVTRPSPDAID